MSQKIQTFSKTFYIAYWKEDLGFKYSEIEYYNTLLTRPIPDFETYKSKKYSGLFDAYDEWGGAEMYY